MFNENLSSRMEEALSSLREGKFVLIYDRDGREEETDFVIPSQLVKPGDIRRMRKDGGGLICTTLTHQAAKKLGMPFLSEIFGVMSRDIPLLGYMIPDDIPYDEISSFSLTINHRETFTGITDNDRALTVTRFGKLLDEMGNLNGEKSQ